MEALQTNRRHCLSLSWAQLLLFAATIQAGAVIGIEAFVFTKWEIYLKPNAREVPPSLTVPTNLALFIFTCIYQIILILDAIRQRNSIQIIAAYLLNVGLLVYAALQRGQIHDVVLGIGGSRDWKDDPLVHIDMDLWGSIRLVLLIIPCIIGAGCLILGFVAWRVTQDWKWDIYKQLHGDLMLKRKLHAFQVYVVLLKLDFFFITAWFAIYSITILQYRGWEFIVNVSAVGVTIILLLLAVFWTKREFMPGMLFMIVFYLGGLSYFIYKIILIYTSPPKYSPYEISIRNLTLYGSLSIASLALTTMTAALCIRNTGQGLKPYFAKTKTQEALAKKKTGPRASLISLSPYAVATETEYDASSQNLLRYNVAPRRLELD